MREILPIAAPFDKLLGKQPYTAGELYRPLKYCVTERVPEGVLLFNNMTKGMVLLSDAELESIAAGDTPLPSLVQLWYYVPESHDDKTLCLQMRNVAKMLRPPAKNITGYTIFTTTDCNARCFYCFEKNTARIPMSPEVAEKTAGFIAGHCGGNEVSISWFGGEPLYNMEAIDIICRRLRERGVPFNSKIVSNGYLFDREIIGRAKVDWELRSVQITLDGTEDVYNKAKAYIYKGVNAFRRVIGNIHLLLDAGIAVDIRLNIDTYNADNLTDLSSLLIDEFSGKQGLSVYVNTLFGDSPHIAVNDPCKREGVYKKKEQLRAAFERAGMGKHALISDYVRTNRCMADSPVCITIFPTGYLGKCDHFTDNLFVGHLDDREGLDHDVLTAFKEVYPEIEACGDCPLYPDCFRLVKCDECRNCFPENRADWLSQMRYEMCAAFYGQRKEVSRSEAITDSNLC